MPTLTGVWKKVTPISWIILRGFSGRNNSRLVEIAKELELKVESEDVTLILNP